MTLAELQTRCFDAAKASGWHDKEIPVPEQVALICSEACEALECFRNKEPLLWSQTDVTGSKPMGIASEYADIVIRVAHYASLLGINLDEVIEAKLAFNATRGHRHGGKTC